MKQNTIILGVILLLVVGGISFGSGYKVAQLKTTSGFTRGGMMANGQFGNTRNGAAQAGGAMRNRQTTGDVVAMDDKTITVKMIDGSSRIVLLSSTMTLNKSVVAQKADLKVGSKVAVFGTTNSDGSQTATSIELDPRIPNLTPAPQK